MKTYLFKSKTNPDDPPHRTTVHDDGTVSCSCRGFLTPKGCWHVERVKEGVTGRTEATPLSFADLARVRAALAEGDDEGAIETVFELFPSMTRDEAVDLVHEIEQLELDI